MLAQVRRECVGELVHSTSLSHAAGFGQVQPAVPRGPSTLPPGAGWHRPKTPVRVTAQAPFRGESGYMTSPAPQNSRNTYRKGTATVGFAGIVLGLAAMIVLHLTSGQNPAYDVLSASLHSPLGWLFPVSLGLFAAGATAFGLLARAGGAPRWMSALLYVWSGLIATVALFPTDPLGTSEYSVVHLVHRYAAFAAFCTMIVLGFAYSRWSGRSERVGRVVAACSWVAVVALVVTSLPYALDFFGAEAPHWTDAAGFNQRATVGSELVALAYLGSWLRGGAHGDGAQRAEVSAPRELVAAA
ncbi:hypothetical protein GCM10029992_23490 [Glycomyces albus]